jgi:hypothetical protein
MMLEIQDSLVFRSLALIRSNPYANRNPWLSSVIYYNTSPIKLDNTGTLWYTFENWENASGTVGIGKDAAGPQATSRTNYHIKKFISMKVNWSMTTVTREPHSKFYYRWAHMILAFAEAANEVEGANGTTFGLSAKNAIKYLRTRKTYDNLSTFTVDPYLDEVAGNADNFRVFIKNERCLETCFEGLHFFDLRRWNTAVTALNNPVHKAKITRNESGVFTYESAVVDNRKFNSIYLPIPYAEMLKMSKLIQNEGWDAWGN